MRLFSLCGVSGTQIPNDIHKGISQVGAQDSGNLADRPYAPVWRHFGYDLTDMANQKILLMIDGLINLVLGTVLLVFPSSLVAFLGVPPAQNAFYPSVLGGVLLGIAVALFVEGRSACDHAGGLGLLGAVCINLCGGLVLGAWLLFGELELPLRGSIFLWSLVVLLVGISSIELTANITKSHSS